MTIIGKHIDLYQLFVYVFPGVLSIFIVYLLFFFNILDISYYSDIYNSELLPPYEGNSLLFLILGFIIAYFIGHIIHVLGIFRQKVRAYFKKVYSEIKKCFNIKNIWGIKKVCLKIKNLVCIEDTKPPTKDYTKDNNNNAMIKKYVIKKMGLTDDGIKEDDYMLVYLFFDEFIQSRKVKLMTTLLGLYKSLFIISFFVFVVVLFKGHYIAGCILAFFTYLFHLQSRRYYKGATDNLYRVAYLYFKDLVKSKK